MLPVILALSASAGPASSGDDCFPLRAAILREFAVERPPPSIDDLAREIPPAWPSGICDGRVFVEEWSACEGAGAGGRTLGRVPADVTTLPALLRAVVDAHNRGPGLDYEVVEHPVGWVVRPDGVDRVFDATVRLAPDRFPTITEQFQDLKDQLREERGIHIGRQPMPDLRDTTPTGVTASETTWLDAVAAIHRPLEARMSERSMPGEPLPRIGLYVSVSDVRRGAATRIVHCEELVAR